VVGGVGIDAFDGGGCGCCCERGTEGDGA